MEKKRNLNADLIRCAAVYSVISVHFLLNAKFYGQPVVGFDMYFMCLMRACFMVCVPLFMILTGYLMWQKKLSKAYYKGIWKTVEIYVLASIACLLYKKYVLGYTTVTFVSGLFDILEYDGANYAWYIEMYFGLFLIIPFLNGAYHSLEGKRQKQILVLTMIGLTMLPKLLNNFNFMEEGWWLSPSLSKEYQKLVPGFFTGMYPITYYFLGAYLREYGCSLGRRKNVFLFVFFVWLFGTYNFYRSDGQNFVWGANSTWGGENLITAGLLFVFLLHLHPERWPGWMQKILITVSQVSLGIYLISWIADQMIYGYFNELIPAVTERWKYYPVIAPAVFGLSFAGACLLYLLRDGIHCIVETLSSSRKMAK